MSDLNALIEKSYNAVTDEIMRHGVVLLHPDSQYRSVLLAKLLDDERFNTFYYSVSIGDTDLKPFIDNLIGVLSTQYAPFGRHLKMLPPALFDDLDQNMHTIVSTFVRELKELNSEHYVLILDEFDRSDSVDSLQTFMEYVAHQLPVNCHLVINARTSPRLPWLALIAENKAAIVLNDQIILEDFYEMKNPGAGTHLKIYGFGQGQIHNSDGKVADWEGHLPRLLLFFSMDKPAATRSEICKAFWPNLGINQGVNVFHVTKRRLHKAIGVDILAHHDNAYTTSRDLDIYYDVLHFVELLVAGRRATGEARFEFYQKAAKLYTGAFLFGHDEPWIVRRRESFRTAYLETLDVMASWWVDQNQKERALQIYMEAIEEDYHREDLHRHLMVLYSDLGRKSEAVAHYNKLADAYSHEKRELAVETQNVYNEIMG